MASSTHPTPEVIIPKASIKISYCSQCNWLLRAAWMAQELLSSFNDELAEVALCPASGGLFQIMLNDELLWDRKTMNGFPDIKQLKQLVRDKVAPERHLGHVDAKPN